MLDWCLRQSTSHRVSVVYHSYGGMVDMWHRNICWSIWALIYSIAGQRQDGHHHRRIQQEEVVWSVVSSCVFLFAWQVMAEGDQSASAAQARSLSGSKHIGQWLLSKVLDKWFGKQLVLWHPAQQPTRAQAQVHALGASWCRHALRENSCVWSWRQRHDQQGESQDGVALDEFTAGQKVGVSHVVRSYVLR